MAARQHGVATRAQLLGLGLSSRAIEHRIAKGRLHPLRRGVYAVGRPQITERGHWMAAVLGCGPEAVLSHGSAAALWQIRRAEEGEVHISVPATCLRRQPGIRLHRRAVLGTADVTERAGIPVTCPALTLLDLASTLSSTRLEAAVNAADKLDLIDPERLREELRRLAGRPGATALRKLLDRSTFRLTDSELERRFLRLIRSARLPTPETGRRVNGVRVDFYWPTLGLIVETDGLRYHRTPAQQARDRLRDQAHARAGLTALRFTHAQIRFEAPMVAATMKAVLRGMHARRQGG